MPFTLHEHAMFVWQQSSMRCRDSLVTMLSSSARTYCTVSSFVTFRNTVVSASIRAPPFCTQSDMSATKDTAGDSTPCAKPDQLSATVLSSQGGGWGNTDLFKLLFLNSSRPFVVCSNDVQILVAEQACGHVPAQCA